VRDVCLMCVCDVGVVKNGAGERREGCEGGAADVHGRIDDGGGGSDGGGAIEADGGGVGG